MDISLLLLTMILSVCCPCFGRETNFLKKTMCPLEEVKCPDALRHTGRLTSVLDCAKECTEDGQCLGFSQAEKGLPNDFGLCLLHYECLYSSSDCHNDTTNHHYYEKEITACENGGIFIEDEQRCDCSHTGGWVGKVCSSAPRTCMDLITWGYNTGSQNIEKSTVLSLEPEELSCYIADLSGVFTSIISIFSDTATDLFNRSWADFENGFYDSGVTWMGLKHVKVMLDILRDKSPLVVLRFESHTTFVEYSYNDLQLGDASSYTIHFNTSEKFVFPGTEEDDAKLPDCLADVRGVEFSTFDQDNDNVSSDNCALISKSGFWYNTTCTPLCNPFGVSYDSNPPQPFSVGASASDTTVWAGQFNIVTMELHVGNVLP